MILISADTSGIGFWLDARLTGVGRRKELILMYKMGDTAERLGGYV
jgi:hypothetical protein